jgi:hypothetical protein
MFGWLSKKAREYRAQAATARTLADAVTDPDRKKYYLDIARHWHDRALDYRSDAAGSDWMR